MARYRAWGLALMKLGFFIYGTWEKELVHSEKQETRKARQNWSEIPEDTDFAFTKMKLTFFSNIQLAESVSWV